MSMTGPLHPPTANQITAELLIEIPKLLPQVCIWRSNRIDAMAIGRGGKKRRVSAGIDGQGDLCGIGPGGRMIWLEVKAEYLHGRDVQSTKQESFEKMIVSHGGIYRIVDRVGWLNGKPDVYKAIRNLEAAL